MIHPLKTKILKGRFVGKKYSYPSSSSSSDSSSSEFCPDDDSCESSCGDVVVLKRKKRCFRKSLEDSKESKHDGDCLLESSSDKQLDNLNSSDDWQLFESSVLSDSSSFLDSGINEDVDMSLEKNKVSFPSQKGNTPENGRLVSSEGE